MNEEAIYLLIIHQFNTIHLCGAFRSPEAAEIEKEKYSKLYWEKARYEIVPLFLKG